MSKTVYHYTDIGALASICQEDGICLRMTNTNCLNDKQELIAGYNLLHSIYPDRLKDNDKSELHNEYVVSLSNAKDCLPMWATYAKNGSGVAIGFNKHELKKWLEKHFFPHGDCIYNRKEFRSKLDETIPLYFYKELEDKKCLDVEAYAQISHDSLMCLLLKHPSFDYENEFRIAKFVYPWASGKDKIPKIKFKERNGILVPFIELKLPYDLLECVMLGPTNNFRTNKLTVELFFKCRGRSKLPIIKSKLPYRG